jgi:hypothetical protein
MGDGCTSYPDVNDPLRLETLFPSDALVGMRNLLASMRVLSPLLRELIQVRLVIDANIVQQEIRWRSARRRDPAARSSLHEAIDSGIVVALAPTFLKSEIEDHLSDISADTGVQLEQVRQHWQDFQAELNFYEPQWLGDRIEGIDPDDLPYKSACEELGADAVYSRDADLRAMKVPVVSVSLDLTLRRHARSSSVVIGVTLGSGFTLMLSFESLRGMYRLIRKGITGFRALPACVQSCMVFGLFAIMAHPKSRARMIEAWSSVCGAVKILKPGVISAVVQIAMQFFAAQEIASQTCAELRSVLPKPRRRTAIQHARSICLISRVPLSVREIEQRMREEGYSTRSKDFARYLRRLLRESRQFDEVAQDVWSLQGVQQRWTVRDSAGHIRSII